MLYMPIVKGISLNDYIVTSWGAPLYLVRVISSTIFSETNGFELKVKKKTTLHREIIRHPTKAQES